LLKAIEYHAIVGIISTNMNLFCKHLEWNQVGNIWYDILSFQMVLEFLDAYHAEVIFCVDNFK
jgi:hypothetical protein